MIKAVVFDFDGVIVDTEPLHHDSYLAALTPREINLSYERYRSEFAGSNDEMTFRRAAEAFGFELSEDELARLRERKADFFRQLAKKGVAPLPGAVELIRLASARAPIALATGARRSDVEAVFSGFGDLVNCFSALVTCDDVRRAKPDPEPYATAAARLGFDPAECVAIEDTPSGLASAAAAGLRTVAVARTHPGSALHADLVVRSLEDLDWDRLAAL